MRAVGWLWVVAPLVWLLVSCVVATTGGHQPAPDAERARAHLDLALGYLERSRFAQAHQAINRALAIMPRSARAHGLRALVHSVEGNSRHAAASYRRALRIDGADSRIRNNYGAFLYANGDYSKACRQLRLATHAEAYPERAGAFENLGLCMLKLGAPIKAREAFQRALALNPKLPRALIERAELALLAGDASTCGQYLERFERQVGPTVRSLDIGIRLARVMGDAESERRLLEIRNSGTLDRGTNHNEVKNE